MEHRAVTSSAPGALGAQRRDLVVGMAVALVAHIAAFVWAAALERPAPPPEKPKARIVQMDVKLPPKPKPKPKPKMEAKAEPKPVPKPVAKPQPKPKPAAKKVAKRSKRKRAKRKKTAQPKRVAKRPPPKPAEPAPLVLSKAYEGSGGVAVEKGDDDILGDPGVEVNERNRTPQPPQVAEWDDDEEDDDEEDEAPGPVIKHARPKTTCKVSWPDEAPAQRRVVSIQLLLTINSRGSVSRAKVLRSVGAPFDAAAVAALRSCAFEPGTRDGRPFTDRVPFVVEFRPDA